MKMTDENGHDNDVDSMIKNPLQNTWHLWYWRNDKNKKEWLDNLMEVTTFSTVEDFWALFNHIEPASHLNTGCDYAYFKNGIKPMWEDKHNENGGRWLFTFQKGSPSLTDQCWLEVLLCLIGEAFGDDSDDVCGAFLNIRRQVDKIAIWMTDYKNTDAIMNVGRILKERTQYPGRIAFELHEGAGERSSADVRQKFMID